MEQRIRNLIQRLTFLGYCAFEIKDIIFDAIGTDCVKNLNFIQGAEVIGHLEKYEQLGVDYLQEYSK